MVIIAYSGLIHRSSLISNRNGTTVKKRDGPFPRHEGPREGKRNIFSGAVRGAFGPRTAPENPK